MQFLQDRTRLIQGAVLQDTLDHTAAVRVGRQREHLAVVNASGESRRRCGVRGGRNNAWNNLNATARLPLSFQKFPTIHDYLICTGPRPPSSLQESPLTTSPSFNAPKRIPLHDSPISQTHPICSGLKFVAFF